MADPALNALDLISMGGLDRPSYIEDPEEALLENREEYNKIVSEKLLPTLTHAAAEIYERPGNRFEQAVEDFYADPGNQALIAPVIAAFEDVMPGLPFVDLIPDPPEELPGTSATGQASDRMRGVIRKVDMATAIWNLPALAKKGIGRIVTNIKRPQSYSFYSIYADLLANSQGELPSSIKNKLMGLGRGLKAVATDKPIFGKAMALEGEAEVLLAREVPYRKGFGLKPRTGKELGLEEIAMEKGWEAFYDVRSADIFLTNPDGTIRFNPDNPIGQNYLRKITKGRRHEYRPGTGSYVGRHPIMGDYRRVPLKEGQEYDPSMVTDWPTRKKYGGAGLIDPKIKGEEKILDVLYGKDRDKTISKVGKWEYKVPAKELTQKEINLQMDAIFYQDTWNFDLSKGEIKEAKKVFDDFKKTFVARYIRGIDITEAGEQFPTITAAPTIGNLTISVAKPTVSLSRVAQRNQESLMKNQLQYLARDMSRYIISKIMDPVEIKGTAKYGKPTGAVVGRHGVAEGDISPTQVINLEDEIYKSLR